MLSISLFTIIFIFCYQYINLYVILTSKEQNHTFHIIRYVRQERGLFTMSILADDKTNIFGRRLRNLRETVMNKTQKEFSEMLGIPQPSLSAYESGKNKPTIDNVILIADKCNVSVDWLCGLDKHNYLNSMGDLVGFLFDLYDANELTFKTEIQNRIDRENPEDGDSGRNLVRLTFYYGDILQDGKPLFSADVCQALEIVQEMHNELKNYECTQEFYDSRKKEMIERYSAFPLTMFNTSSLTEKERFDRRLAVMRAILDAETAKNKKDEN